MLSKLEQEGYMLDADARRQESARLYGALEAAVNGPLDRINNCIEQIRSEISGADPELVQRIGGLLTILEDQALDLARLSTSIGETALCCTGKMAPQGMVADLSGQLASLVEMVQDYARRKGFELEFFSDGEALTVVDPVMLDRVVLNLISNAMRHGRENGHVLVQLRAEGKGYCLSVTDDGFGIPARRQEHLTEMFGEADEAFPGGTGLYLVDQFCQLMGWTLEWESGAQGTRFSVHIPPVEPKDVLMLRSSPRCMPDLEQQRRRVRMELLGQPDQGNGS
ncbi:MAG: HAMP domain-containing histidine kinase [Oscillospiraceae bacterium]|nr:HAMP domain-containing histidine kinase [Oscillospiraceae bacterium]